MNFWQEVAPLITTINENLEKYYGRNKDNPLYTAFEYAMQGGGKRLRPIVTILCSGSITSSIENAIGPALAIEILHNFTLIHDDIMDNSPIRHNKPTVPKKWNNDIAILTGDMMIGWAFLAIEHEQKFNNNISTQLYKTLGNALVEVCEGQQLDMTLSNNSNVNIEDYYKIIKFKTASLFICAAKLGAISASADDNLIDAVEQYALNLGYAFQIQDDILDFNAKNVKFGKQIGQDVIEHKKTFPIIKAKELATKKDDIHFITSYFNNELDIIPLHIQQFIDIFNRLNIFELANNETNNYVNKALKELGLLKDNKYTEMLKLLLQEMTSRTY